MSASFKRVAVLRASSLGTWVIYACAVQGALPASTRRSARPPAPAADVPPEEPRRAQLAVAR
jgi:hypothetical protein